MIIDSHAHLGDERLADRTDEISQNLLRDNLESVFEVGYDLASSQNAIRLADSYDAIYAIIGTHPHDAKYYDDESENFYLANARHKKVLAIGEIGLDYFYDKSERDVQRDVFARQIELADKVGLPIALHIRDAYGDAIDILQAHRDKLNCGVLLHCYCGSAEMIKRFDKFDCYYALGGAITFKNAKKDDVVKAIRQDRLLVETDCPYMTPVPFRGQPNEPKYVNLVVQKIAEIKGVDREEIERLTLENTKRLFFKYGK
ncbi:MAG: TatD family hydrolase [Clostridia bacterium]|nr:TatD family hydrolase [Clostridia bacterium]